MNGDKDDLEVKRPRIIWSYLFCVAFLATCVALFIPAFAGSRLDPISGFSAMLWSSLFFWSGWRYQLKIGWHGGLLGAVVGLLLFMLAAFVSGYIRASGG